MGTIKRAISEEQKLERKNHIQNTALKLLKIKSYNEINMESIAKEANVAKGTVFVYFSTKEELFLSIAEKMFNELFENINQSLLKLTNKNQTKEELSKIIPAYLKTNPILTKLIAILNTTLEKNIDYDTAYKFKKMMHDNIIHTGTIIEKLLPELKSGYGIKIMLWGYILIIGIQHVTDPSKIAKEVIEKGNLQGFNLKFDDLFNEMISLIFNGLGI
jgi:AcrR family transcriptional regulator